MHSPVEKKFNEYLGNIHTILRDDASYLSDPSFLNQLLDRMEYIKRNFILLNAEKEDVFVYQEHLARLSQYVRATLDWVDAYHSNRSERHEGLSALCESLFLMGDMFDTSEKLIKSFYPVI